MAGMDTEEHWRNQLRRGLDRMGLALSQAQQQQLTQYLSLLLKWNRAFNLTAVRDPSDMVSRHLLDSLSILTLLQGTRILDVGTGPGLPGIPLAIARPDSTFVLLDSNGKKTRFVRQVKMQLTLQNVEVIQGRVEAYRSHIPFDTLVCRAFAPLQKILSLTSHLLSEQALLLAMKGTLRDEKISLLKQVGYRIEVVPLRVAQSAGQRHAILCRL